MLDATGRPVSIDCSVINTMVISALLRCIRGMTNPVSCTTVRTRNPNAYNKHVSNILSTIGEHHPEWSRRQRLKHAVDTWSEIKKQRVAPRVTVKRDL